MSNQFLPTRFSLKEILRFLVFVVGLCFAGWALVALPDSYSDWRTYLFLIFGALPLLRSDLEYRLRYITIIFLWTGVVGVIELIANYKSCWQTGPICHAHSIYGYALIASYFLFWLVAGFLLNRKSKAWP